MDGERKLELTQDNQDRINEEVRFVSGSAHPGLMKEIAAGLGENVWTEAELDLYPDGEIDVHIERTIRGKNVWIAQPLCRSEGRSVNDNLVEFLLMADAVRRASAKTISAFIPYYGYARQDRKETGRVPISAKLVANLIETAGADRVLTYDLHAGQIQGFFDIPVDNLNVYDLEARWITENYPLDKVSIVGPDTGAAQKARKVAKAIKNYTKESRGYPADVAFAVIDKVRKSARSVTDYGVLGEVREICIMIDDIISTFGSMDSGAVTLNDEGASEIHAFATHGLFAGDAWEKISRTNCPITTVATTDTTPLNKGYESLDPDIKEKVKRISIAEHSLEVIKRIILDKSVSAVFPHS